MLVSPRSGLPADGVLLRTDAASAAGQAEVQPGTASSSARDASRAGTVQPANTVFRNALLSLTSLQQLSILQATEALKAQESTALQWAKAAASKGSASAAQTPAAPAPASETSANLQDGGGGHGNGHGSAAGNSKIGKVDKKV